MNHWTQRAQSPWVPCLAAANLAWAERHLLWSYLLISIQLGCSFPGMPSAPAEAHTEREAPDYKWEDWRVFFRCDRLKRMFVEVVTWEQPRGQIPTKSTLTLKMRGKDYLNKVKWPWISMSWKNLRHFRVSLKFDYFSAIRGKHSGRDHLVHPQFPLLWSSKIVKYMTNLKKNSSLKAVT